MRKSRIQWHSACCGAIELEFRQDMETETERKIKDITELCQEMGLSKMETTEKVQSRCGLAKRTATLKVKKYWKYEGDAV